MAPSIQHAIDEVLGQEPRLRLLHVQEFPAGAALLSQSQNIQESSRNISHRVTIVKLFIRTTGPAPDTPSPDAGTDVGMELWLPDPAFWNKRVRCQIAGGFMGDFRVTSPGHFSLPICTELPSGEIASELGFVVATTDGGHATEKMDDFRYLMAADGSVNTEGWKNVAYEATHLLGITTKKLAAAYYGYQAEHSYLYGCSTGGRAAYHSAQKYPDDFDGLLIGAPSLTQSLMFPSILHPLIVIQNDLGGQPFLEGQLEKVSERAIAAGDSTVNGSHDGYITDWESNSYDPTRDLSVLAVSSGGKCTEPWALSLAQANAINKIWYGPTLDGTIPDPSQDNGSRCPRAKKQLYWGRIRGTRIDYATFARQESTGLLALSLQDSSVASPAWLHPTGNGKDAWKDWTYDQYAKALLRCQSMNETFENMDADQPDKLDTIQKRGAKILTYHGLADTVTAPQNAINYYRSSSHFTGGMETTQDFHRLFLIPGMDHCIRSRGCVGDVNPPIPTLEELFQALINWVENGEAPDYLIAHSIDGKRSRPISRYTGHSRGPNYLGGDVNAASSYEA